jgi:hypothetical protein
MKARLAVIVVAVALAIGGALHLARTHESRPSALEDLSTLVEPTAMQPGGWWDWH